MIGALIFAAAETHAATGYSLDWRHIFQFLIHGLSVLSILGGLFFVLAGTFGVLRLPDFFTRLHSAGMIDTLGAELIILGLILQAGFSQMSLKLLLVAVFLILTSPTATHAVASAANHAGLKPLVGRYKAPDPVDMDGGEHG